MDLVEIEWAGVDWIGLAQDSDKRRAIVNAVMNLLVPFNAGELSSGCTTGGLTKSGQFFRVSYFIAQVTPKDITTSRDISE
jgi:hypothetical protein